MFNLAIAPRSWEPLRKLECHPASAGRDHMLAGRKARASPGWPLSMKAYPSRLPAAASREDTLHPCLHPPPTTVLGSYSFAMSRLPYLRRSDLDDSGQALWDAIVSTRGRTVVNDAGGLVGPFNAWVHAPGVGARLSALGATLRFETLLERRLLELAIIVVAAHWKAEFEWWAPARMARENGVDDAIVAAIESGETPSFEADDEAVV